MCKGLALTREENGLDLTVPPLYVCDGPAPDPAKIHVGPRVGIDYAEEAVDFPWRFWAEEDGYAVFDLDGTLLDSNGVWLDIDVEF